MQKHAKCAEAIFKKHGKIVFCEGNLQKAQSKIIKIGELLWTWLLWLPVWVADSAGSNK